MSEGGKKNKHILLAIMEINNTNFSRMILIYFSLQTLGHLVKNLVPEQKLNGRKVGNSYSNEKLGQGEEKKLWREKISGPGDLNGECFSLLPRTSSNFLRPSFINYKLGDFIIISSVSFHFTKEKKSPTLYSIFISLRVLRPHD